MAQEGDKSILGTERRKNIVLLVVGAGLFAAAAIALISSI